METKCRNSLTFNDLSYFSMTKGQKQNQAIMGINNNQGSANLQKVKIDE